MKPTSMLLSASFFLLANLACLNPSIEIAKRATMLTFIEGWKGKSFKEFLKTTGWNITHDSGYVNNASVRIVEFDAFGRSKTSTAYYYITQHTDNNSEPVETIKIPGIRSGCKLIVWVNPKGLISSWRTEGGDCFIETMDRLKK
jgi:hypothetical protein